MVQTVLEVKTLTSTIPELGILESQKHASQTLDLTIQVKEK